MSIEGLETGGGEDASRIIIETYLRPLRCSTVPLTTRDAFPVIIPPSQCRLKETTPLVSPHGWHINFEKRRVNEGLGARMGNSRDDLDDGCECPHGILAPYGGAIGASQRVNFLWDETLSLPHVLCWPTSTGQRQTVVAV